ncbi:Major Facilitator Superfamily protein [Ophiocordyceps camponoti-floridani]|uniref:Major Facilitator Superfamily protein n=1 Tax=Ophiocordyceps camponoti-floridani TaxID=2030778 RepID=A0A8H4QEB1_9HYPO|nr:Major Facilitator Superfamily protein [Ophiocordyceps camponoti-floridani]
MNFVTSVGWLTFAPITPSASRYYQTPASKIAWLSTAFLLSFLISTPPTILLLHRGPKPALVTAAVLIIVGNWVRYAAGRSFAGAGEGRCHCCGEFGESVGGAVAQLVVSMVVKGEEQVLSLLLYVAIINPGKSTIASLPAFILPSRPPTPISASSTTAKLNLKASMRQLIRSPELFIVMVPFAVVVGFFNTLSSLLNQIMVPYGFTDDEAGIAGAILIFVGLVSAAISSPLVDRTKAFVRSLKLLLPVIALCFVLFIWMPETRHLAGPYVVITVLGAASFASLPVALEFLAEVSHPLSPEVTSTVAWAAGQLLGAVFIIISGALAGGPDADPPHNLKRALIFQGVVAATVCPLPLLLGLFGRQDKVALRRVDSDRRDGAAADGPA